MSKPFKSFLDIHNRNKKQFLLNLAVLTLFEEKLILPKNIIYARAE